MYEKSILNIKSDKLKVKKWRKIHQDNTNQQTVQVVILILDKTDFRIGKSVRKKKRFI